MVSTMAQNIVPIESIKKLATPEELELYSYVSDRAELVAEEVVTLVKQGNKTGDGGSVFIYGPQNAGKTLAACLILDMLSQNGLVVTAIQPEVDRSDVPKDRYFSRSGVERQVHSVGDRTKLMQIFSKSDVVIIDEVQFFPHDFQSFFLKVVTDFIERGGWVIPVGVLYTAQASEFLLSAVLKERATQTFELTATCQKCGVRGAKLNQRLVNGVPTTSDDPELLAPSANVLYEPRCNDCHVTSG